TDVESRLHNASISSVRVGLTLLCWAFCVGGGVAVHPTRAMAIITEQKYFIIIFITVWFAGQSYY
ncbi:hypothetical protein DC08_19495, partial [Salmonella enterica subsp. enterica serovar Heidelberg]